MAKRKPKTEDVAEPRISDVSELVSSWDGKQVAIFTHPTPDPDAIGSAFALQWIAKQTGAEAKIFYSGDVSHPQNKTMVNCLGIVLCRSEDFDPEKFQLVATVDSTPKNAAVDESDIVIDHHRVDANADFIHIDNVGATATLIWEYIEALDLHLGDDVGANIATALYMGIITDTDDLRNDNATDRDQAASWALLKLLDRKKLDNILQYELPSYFFELRNISSRDDNNMMQGTCWVSSVGIIPPSKRDVLPMLADDMIKREGVAVAVVIAVINDELQASIRSKNNSLDINDFCWKVFGREYAGGKHGMAGAKVPLGLCSLTNLAEEIKDEFWSAFKVKFFHQILHVASGNA